MEISLKLELSEDQYNDLMQKSYDEIFKSPQMIDALKDIIIENFNSFFQNNDRDRKVAYGFVTSGNQVRNLCEKALITPVEEKSYGNYSVSYEPSVLMRQLVTQATEDQRQTFYKSIQEILDRIISDKDLVSKILTEVLLNSIMNGLSMGSKMNIEQSQYNGTILKTVQGYLENR